MKTGTKISLFLVGSVVLACACMIGFGREYLRNRQIDREIASLQEENDRLEGKRLQFLGLIDDLSSEYYLEEQARTKQGLAKPGETLIIVDDGGDEDRPAGKVLGAADEISGMSNPAKWLWYFFDRERFADLHDL